MAIGDHPGVARCSYGGIVVLASVLVVSSLQCGSSVEVGAAGGQSSSTTTSQAGGHDAGPPPDAGTDAAASCGGEALDSGFVIGTAIEPVHPSSQIDDYVLSGTLSYLGPITEPLATNPAFDREIRLMHVDGSESILQYYLPLDLELPVVLNRPYTVTFRRRWGFDGYAVGVVITRPTSGLPPLLFVAEGGQYGRALEPEDLLMAPLKVYQEQDPSCPTEPFPECNGTIYRDLLRFDSSTGGAVIERSLYQAEMGTLPIFGEDFLVVNLSSTRIEPTCPDHPGGRVSFLALSAQASL